MEELGIGRPSTYASIVTTIQDREYVRKDKNRLIPEDKGRIVTIFLLNFFRKYVGYEFTANLEEELDDVSARARRTTRKVLADFWRDFSARFPRRPSCGSPRCWTSSDEALAPQLYPPREMAAIRAPARLRRGQLHLKTSRTGGFVGCSRYPECRYTRPIGGEEQGGDRVWARIDAGDEISLRTGRFGPYVQRGEVTEDNKKPPRASLPKGWAPDDMDLEKALMLLSLPREVGRIPRMAR
jgi:DNA topoisomerase-1